MVVGGNGGGVFDRICEGEGGTGLDFFNAEAQRSRSEHRGRTGVVFGGEIERRGLNFFEEKGARGAKLWLDGLWLDGRNPVMDGPVGRAEDSRSVWGVGFGGLRLFLIRLVKYGDPYEDDCRAV